MLNYFLFLGADGGINELAGIGSVIMVNIRDIEDMRYTQVGINA